MMFDMSVVKNCEMDEVTLVSGFSTPSLYYIGETALVLNATFTHVFADCPIHFDLSQVGMTEKTFD